MTSTMHPLHDSLNDNGHPGDPPWMHKLDVRVVRVTPRMAQEWLGRNAGNRRPKLFNIDRFARDMVNGRWQVTGEALIFDADDNLRNGQNRLMACIKSGAAFNTLVVWGVDPGAFKNMDRGSARTVGDVMQILGIENSNVLSAACGFICRHERGLAPGVGGKSAPTPEEALDALERHPEIEESVRWSRGSSKVGISSPSYAVYLHWRLSQFDTEAADVFFEALYSGANLAVGNPVLALIKGLSTGTRSRVPVALCGAYTFKAWNYWGSGSQLRMVKFNPKLEKYPTPNAPTSLRWMLPAE